MYRKIYCIQLASDQMLISGNSKAHKKLNKFEVVFKRREVAGGKNFFINIDYSGTL